jgi:hypothetical protein
MFDDPSFRKALALTAKNGPRLVVGPGSWCRAGYRLKAARESAGVTWCAEMGRPVRTRALTPNGQSPSMAANSLPRARSHRCGVGKWLD